MSEWKIMPKANMRNRLADNTVSVVQNGNVYRQLSMSGNIAEFLGQRATLLINETEIALLPAGQEGRMVHKRAGWASSRLILPRIDLTLGKRTTRMEEIPGFGMAVIFSKTPDPS